MKSRVMRCFGWFQVLASMGLLVVTIQLRRAGNEFTGKLLPNVANALQTSSELTLQVADDIDRIATLIETRGPEMLEGVGGALHSARNASDLIVDEQLPAWEKHITFMSSQIDDVGAGMDRLGRGMDISIPSGMKLNDLTMNLPWDNEFTLRIKPALVMSKPFAEVARDFRNRGSGVREIGKQVRATWRESSSASAKTISNFSAACKEIEGLLKELESEAKVIRSAELAGYIEKMKEAEVTLKQASETIGDSGKVLDNFLLALVLLSLCILASGVARLFEWWPAPIVAEEDGLKAGR